MRRRWGFAFLHIGGLFALSISVPATAQEPPSTTSGASTLNACRDLERNRTDGTSGFQQGYCLGAVNAAALLHDRSAFCIPGPRPKLQLVRIVINYIERHPETQDRELGVLASYALSEAFPCAR